MTDQETARFKEGEVVSLVAFLGSRKKFKGVYYGEDSNGKCLFLKRGSTPDTEKDIYVWSIEDPQGFSERRYPPFPAKTDDIYESGHKHYEEADQLLRSAGL